MQVSQDLLVRILPQLELEEGVELKPYTDTVGKLTVGIGRNLTDVGVSLDEARYLAENDVSQAISELNKYGWFAQLTPVRQVALISMMFNIGASRFAGFHLMIEALENGDYGGAATQMLDSLWATQVRSRSTRIAQMIRTNEWPTDVKYPGV